MADNPKNHPSDPNPSTSEFPIRSNLSSPSVPNQTGKSTRDCIDKQIGALKDALAIPFLASPPQSNHEGKRIPAPPVTTSAPHPIPAPTITTTSQPPHTLPPQFHYTPYTTSPANTTYYDLRQPSVQPHPISSPYHHPATMASAIPPYLQPST